MENASSTSSGIENIDVQARLISPCVNFRTDGEVVPDIPAMLKRLLLFETVILQTIRFREFVPLVRTLGADNVVALLNSGALQLQLDPTQIIQTGQTEGFPACRDKPPLPLRSYAFSLLKGAHPNDYLVRNLQDLRRQLYGPLSQADLSRVEQAIMRALLLPRQAFGFDAIVGQKNDLRSNSPVLIKAMALKIRRECGREVSEENLRLKLTPIDDTDYRAESNLADLAFGVEDEHRVIESALLAVGVLNLRIEEMRSYGAVSGLIDKELDVFDAKISFLRASVLGSAEIRPHGSSAEREGHFDRVIKIRRLPDIGQFVSGNKLDMHRFLEIRDSKECREFRSWIRTTQLDSDDEIAHKINWVRVKLASFIHGHTGRGIRLGLSTLAGLAPPEYSNLIGLALGVVDSFILDKFLPISGPILFISHQYPSLFRASDNKPSQ